MTNYGEYGRDYLRLVLEIEKHIPGYVDAYLGPAGIKKTISAQDKKEPAQLITQLHHLQDTLPTADPARKAYLTATLRAIETTLRMLNGEKLSYLEEVSHIYDIEPQLVDEAQFDTSINELDTILPGTGTLAERLETYNNQFLVPTQDVLPLLQLAIDETRQRTRKLVGLVFGESITLQLAQNQPWGAYNWYLGAAKSLVEFNTDLPTNVLGILSTMAHEAYPGHHTEGQIKERHLWIEQGYAEHAAYLLHSPAAVISEGIATQALEMIFPGRSAHQWNLDILLPAANITATPNPDLSQHTRQLRYVSGNAAILYHTGQLTQEQTIDYIQTYSLRSHERAAKSFSFIASPLFRSYVFTYTHGYDLITQASQTTDKNNLFSRLLTEQVLPSQLLEI